MQLRYEQLKQHVEHHKPLACIYCVSGDTVLLVQTACDILRNHAKKQGFAAREVVYAEGGLDWQALLMRSHHDDLFAEKKVIELHFPSTVSEEAAHMLQTYARHPPVNKLLLVITRKLDRRTLQARWFKSIDQVGVCLTVRPIERYQLPLWITERLASVGLTVTDDAIQYLASATEGNLLASAQAIEKLRLYLESNTPTPLTLPTMMQILADHACFDPFQLLEAALQGDATRCLRILRLLQEEGVEPLLILWSLSRECRQLAALAFQLAQGHNLQRLFQQYAIWEKRQTVLRQALQRHTLGQWHALVMTAAHCDRLIKGIVPGNIWDAFEQFTVQLAGTETV